MQREREREWAKPGREREREWARMQISRKWIADLSRYGSAKLRPWIETFRSWIFELSGLSFLAWGGSSLRSPVCEVEAES